VPPRRVLIVGSGLAGFCLARAIDRRLTASASLQVTLLSPSTASTFSALVPGVVSGWVEPWQLRVPLRPNLRHVALTVGRAVSVDWSANRVFLQGPGVLAGCEPGWLEFDELVFACGTAAGHRAAVGPEGGLQLRSLDDALRVRNRLSELLEAACGEDSARRRRAICTVLVAGHGVAACAAALELSHRLERLAPLFPRVEPGDARAVLVCERDELCPEWGPAASAQVAALLQRAGVEVFGNASVEAIANDHVVVRRSDGATRIDARTVVWAHNASTPAAVARWAGAPLEGGRLRVDEMLRVVGTQSAYALGDCAVSPVQAGRASTPALVRHQAAWLADCIVGRAHGRAPRAIASRPWLDPVLLDRDHGLLRAGERLGFGRLPAWLARRSVLALVPTLSRRAAVKLAWTLQRHLPSAQGDPSRLQPSHEPLYLTAPPPRVR
jgi:NADH dehydrogenase